MNILIVGNGFDLSHYLPTKYDHFMVAMDVIENWDEAKDDMGFDDLFGSLYEKEDYFFGYTKAMYKTDEIKISVNEIKRLKEKLKGNVWYQYFSDHVREVKTWIDFELKIEDALKSLCKFFKKIEENFNTSGVCDAAIHLLEIDRQQILGNYYISRLECEQLFLLKLISKNPNYGQHKDFWTDEKFANINSKWFVSVEKSEYGFSQEKYLSFLLLELEKFSDLFNSYLELIINKLNLIQKIIISNKDWVQPDHIYSFNYTNTFQRIHELVDIEYLHGRHGEQQNIVLGISDLEDDTLKKLKAYGFTKYHQKLFKDTDYLFLDSYKEIIKESAYELSAYDSSQSDSPVKKSSQRKVWEKRGVLNLNFLIWGHSLDVSDKDYIIDLFSLNNDMDRNVRVTIFYFDKPAKFSLLNNLLAILGKDKVEQWMKNKWLEFKPNPEVKFEVDSNLEEAS